MSWKIKTGLKSLLRKEEGAVIKDFGGKVSYALVYPNTYHIGMSNLGVHNVYRLLNARDGVVCERAFLPGKEDLREHRRTGTPLLTVESQRPLADFDVVAFSVAYENDISNIGVILELSSLEKGGRNRLVAGGAAVTLHPELFQGFFDEVLTGDFEGDPLLPARSVVWTDCTEFGSMHLVEMQRGCPHRCRFCAAPVIYRPFRQFREEDIIKAIDEGLPHRKKIGLIGGDVLAHPSFIDIAKYIHSKGASFSPSSVRADRVTPEVAKLLRLSGHKTVTLAPETGSQGLRKRLGKGISDEKLFAAAGILAREGILRLKLYFMIGLPHETDEDIASIPGFIERLRKEVPGIRLTVAVNPFVPKRKTAFQRESFAGVADLKRKITALKKMMARTGGVELKIESPLAALREYEFQK